MIPKVIHYCWFGGKPKPEAVEKYIETWKNTNPDYEIKEWNESNFDVNILPFTREAYLAKKYAFVADVARIYALIQDGGIYLDTDVEVTKSFDSFLMHNSFLGKETPFICGSAVIGAVKGCQWLKEYFQETYTPKRHFIQKDGKIITPTNTIEITNFLSRKFPDDCGLTIYDVDVLCGILYFNNGEKYQSERTAAIHHFSSTWMKRQSLGQRIVNRVRNIAIRNTPRLYGIFNNEC